MTNEYPNLQLSFTDIEILSNCIGETLEALDEWEVDTRVGSDVEYLRTLRHKLNVVTRGRE